MKYSYRIILTIWAILFIDSSPALACLEKHRSGSDTHIVMTVVNNCGFDVDVEACGFIGPSASRQCSRASIWKNDSVNFDFYKSRGEYFDFSVSYTRN